MDQEHWGNPKPPGAYEYNDRLCATVDYLVPEGFKHYLILWHRRSAWHGWLASEPRKHQMDKPIFEIQVEDLPTLTITPSLYWPECCGMHGFLTNGVWRDV